MKNYQKNKKKRKTIKKKNESTKRQKIYSERDKNKKTMQSEDDENKRSRGRPKKGTGRKVKTGFTYRKPRRPTTTPQTPDRSETPMTPDELMPEATSERTMTPPLADQVISETTSQRETMEDQQANEEEQQATAAAAPTAESISHHLRSRVVCVIVGDKRIQPGSKARHLIQKIYARHGQTIWSARKPKNKPGPKPKTAAEKEAERQNKMQANSRRTGRPRKHERPKIATTISQKKKKVYNFQKRKVDDAPTNVSLN